MHRLINFIKMKLFNVIVLFLTAGFLASCSLDADPIPVPVDELEGLKLVTSIQNDGDTIGLYSASGKLTTGYNEVFFRIKKKDGNLVDNSVKPSWTPQMKMMDSSHSCPASQISPREGTSSVFGGFILFTMAENEAGYWELGISYKTGDASRTVTGRIPVASAPRRIVESFEGTDSLKYVVAMLEPVQPVAKENDMSALLYRLNPSGAFEPVTSYTIKIDPRMPAMSNNHGSVNNVDLTYKDGFYKGKVNLTMTGYWKINLQVANEKGEVIKGEPVTESHKGSSIYFEIEF